VLLIAAARAQDAGGIAGGVQQAVHNGERGSRSEFPYQVALVRHGRQFCGGTIVDSRSVVTAAHCFQQDSSTNGLTVLIADNVVTGQGRRYSSPVSRVIVDRQWRGHAPNDVTVLHVQIPFDFSDPQIQPLPMAAADGSDDPRRSNDVVTVSGYGQNGAQRAGTQILMFARQMTEPCRDGRDDAAICTKAEDDRGVFRSACMGDSGGPLRSQGGKLVGIVSHGRNCVGETWYTKVSANRAFIDANLAGGGNRPPVRDSPVREIPPPRQETPTEPSIDQALGSCPGGRRPAHFYDSGCRAASNGQVVCTRPPAPLGTLPSSTVRQMQSFTVQAQRFGDTSICCREGEQFFCRGPRGGFPPGTPGVSGGGSSSGGGQSPSGRRPSNGGWCDADCRIFVEMRNGRQVRVQRCRQVPC